MSKRYKTSRYFVTGTGTGVGKTEAACALLSLLNHPWAYKPCESGGTGDARALRQAGGGWQQLDTICRYRFKAPLAPYLAARQERRRVDFQQLIDGFHALGDGPGVVEGAGGLHVPLTARHDVIDLMEALDLPVVLVARASLGTINDTTLSLNAMFARQLEAAAVVLVQATPHADASVKLNRVELQRRFPGTRFLGPVPFSADAKRRRALLRRALQPLVG